MRFEIQVRTVLQHAWAEITHDRSYKFGQALPVEIERKLNLHAGLLEIADSAFDEIATEIDVYSEEIKSKPAENLRLETINAISLKQFLDREAAKGELNFDNDDKYFDNSSSEIVSELREFGLRNIGDLEKVISGDFLGAAKKTDMSKETRIGLLRSVMLYADLEKYLDEVEFKWSVLDYGTFDFLCQKYDPERILHLLRHHEIELNDQEAE